MTHDTAHIPDNGSQFDEAIGTTLTTVVLVLFSLASVVALAFYAHL